MMKKGSSHPSEGNMILFHMVAIETFFRMSLMYLKQNHEVLRTAMAINRKELDPKVVDLHLQKMNSIMNGFYPKKEQEIVNFRTLEKWVGHDIFVNALAAEFKCGGVGRFRVFEKAVSESDWKAFETAEVSAGRPRPDREEQYPQKPLKKGVKSGKWCGNYRI